MGETWTEVLVTSFREVGRRLLSVIPQLLAVLTLIAAGLILATAARRLTVRMLQAADFDRRCARWGLTSGLHRSGLRQSPTLFAGRLVFWTIFLVAGLMGVQALEMPATAGLVFPVLHLVPNLILAMLISVTGWVLANFLGEAALIGAVNAQVAGAPLIAAAVRWLVLVFAGAAAITQLGIAREMVLLAFGIAFGGIILALALAFGLGAKDLARDILESRLRKHEEEGDRLTHV